MVPKSLRRDMLYRLHYAHSGVVSTLLLARESIYWPGMSAEIKQFIEMCDVCRAFDRKQPKETLIPHEVPDRPWAKVGVDLFTYRGRNCLICVDHYSSFWEIDSLDKTTSGAVVHKLKSHFARHGIPETCVSDNGPQFTSTEFKEFSRQWKFVHVTSSPAYLQRSGKVEAAVNSAKNVMRKSRKARTDPYLALLEYRNTPSQGLGTSPVQRLMSRRTRAQVPIIPKLLRPVVGPKIYRKLLAKKERQVLAYNRGAKDLGAVRSGDTLQHVPPGNPSEEAVKAKVERCVGTRSFEVATEDGARYRRNRRHLRKTKEACRNSRPALVAEEGVEQSDQQSTSLPEQAQTGDELSASCKRTTVPSGRGDATNGHAMASRQPEPLVQPSGLPVQGPTTRSGRVVKKPAYLRDYVTGM